MVALNANTDLSQDPGAAVSAIEVSRELHNEPYDSVEHDLLGLRVKRHTRDGAQERLHVAEAFRSVRRGDVWTPVAFGRKERHIGDA
jgi:hypothetical protein